MSGSGLDRGTLRSEIEARLGRGDPTPADLRHIREWLGLSQYEMAGVLGFKKTGHFTVRWWEDGKRNGFPFKPTPTVWAAIRYLTLSVMLYRQMPSGAARESLRVLLPEVVLA